MTSLEALGIEVPLQRSAMRRRREAPQGPPGTGEPICRVYGGSRRDDERGPCALCEGTGKVTVFIGGV